MISIWGALILRAAEIAGCRRVLSEDLADGRIYGSIVVENPLATPGQPPMALAGPGSG